MDNWQTVEAEIGRIISAERAQPFNPATIAQVQDFIAFVRDRCPVPDGVGKGYWSTISLSWPSGPHGFEVEIFGDRIETYRFYDRRSDIRHFSHCPGSPFPPDLIAQLPVLGTRD